MMVINASAVPARSNRIHNISVAQTHWSREALMRARLVVSPLHALLQSMLPLAMLTSLTPCSIGALACRRQEMQFFIFYFSILMFT